MLDKNLLPHLVQQEHYEHEVHGYPIVALSLDTCIGDTSISLCMHSCVAHNGKQH